MKNMTPKEKAEELFNKCYMILFDSDSDKGEECLVSILAGKCAILCVDEILSAIDWHDFETPNKEFEFWNEVKLEIEKV
jgi:hypothetical protein